MADAREKLKPESLLSPPFLLHSVLTYTTFLLWSAVDDLNMSFACAVSLFGEGTVRWETLRHDTEVGLDCELLQQSRGSWALVISEFGGALFALSLCAPIAPWDLGSVWDARPGVGGLQLCRTEGCWLRGEDSMQQQLKTLRKGPDFHRPPRG